MLNIGLFAQDFSTVSKQQNVINSVTEYIAEVLLEKADSFPEKHVPQNHSHHKHSHSLTLKVQHYMLFKHNPVVTAFAFNTKSVAIKYALENDLRLQDVIFDITPPPPKV